MQPLQYNNGGYGRAKPEENAEKQSSKQQHDIDNTIAESCNNFYH